MSSELNKLGITELKNIAKELKISGYAAFRSANKDELVELILANGYEPKRSAKRSSKRSSKQMSKQSEDSQ